MIAIPRFRPLRELGQGAMGAVWLVEDRESGAQVALKVVASAQAPGPELRAMFRQEFRLMARLRHPNCCAVHDYGTAPGGEPYFTMEVVAGHGLDEVLPLEGARFEDVFAQLLAALAYLHGLGYVHRDLKPANVRVTPDGTVKLMDYGLMEVIGAGDGAVRGTLPYLAPEVIRRGPIDRRTDLYSAGALGYELLTGRPPFVGATPREVVQGHLAEAPQPPSRLRRGVDPRHEALVLKLLQKEPMARCQDAGEALRALGRAAAAAPGGALLAAPLVGRGELLDQLEAQVARIATREGPGASIVLHGPPGIGKSRLLTEAHVLAQLADVPCGACHAGGDPTPYAPVVALLRGLLPALRERVPAALAAHAAVLVRLLPELGVTPLPALDAHEHEKARLHGAVAATLQALADAAGLVVLVHGWERPEPLTAELFARLPRLAGERPLLLVTSSRAAPPPGFGALAVGALDEPAVGRMAASMLGREGLAPAFVARLTDLAGGNPLHVERLLALLSAEGRLVPGAGGGDGSGALDGIAGPASPESVLAARLQALPPDARLIAQAAAIMPLGADVPAIAAMLGFTADHAFDALHALAQAGVLAARPDGTWAFAEAALRDLLEAEVGSDDRAALHAAAAHELAARVAGQAPEAVPLATVSAIVHHALGAGDAGLTTAWAMVAGRRHAALFANAAAEGFFVAGLAAARARGEAAAVQLDYLEALADLRRLMGRPAQALDAAQAALALAREAGDGRRAGRLLASLARACQPLGRLDEAIAHADAAAAASLAAADPANAARALLTRARVLALQGQPEPAAAAAEAARSHAAAAGDPVREAEALAFSGYALGEAGLGHLARAVALLEPTGEQIALEGALLLLGDVQNKAGRHEAAIATFERCRAICEALGYDAEHGVVLVNLGLAQLALGKPAPAITALTEAVRLARAHGNRYAVAGALAQLARAEAQAGKPERVAERLAEARAIAAELGQAYLATFVEEAAALATAAPPAAPAPLPFGMGPGMMNL